MMLMRKPNPRSSRFKYAMIFPLALLLILACSTQVEDFEKESIDSENIKQEIVMIEDIPKKESDINTYNDEKLPKPLNLKEIRKMVGYPQICIDAGIQGLVLFRILVDKEGNYVEHEIVKSAHIILTKAIEKHIAKLKFEPSSSNNKATSFQVTVPFNFILLN